MVNITLEMVDELIEKTGVSYEQAKRILQETDGDVPLAIQRLVNKEQDDKHFSTDALDEVVAKIKEAIEKGTAARLMVKKDDKIVLNIPAVLGFVGLMNPFLTAAGIGGVILTGHEIVIENKDGSIIDVNEMIDKAAGKVKETGEDLYEKMKEAKAEAANKAEDVADDFEQHFEDLKDDLQERAEDVKDDVEKL
ncbi:MAG TPA: DUF4342 domain-containing protein [Tissierellia bacterium]|nr:DUF4342 domain-containing protein [Tissierellia bacterium]